MINIKQLTKLGLKGKTIIGQGALLLFALLVMGGAIYFQAMTLAIHELLESTGKNIEKDTIEIENFVESAKDDLMVMASTPPVQGILRARDNNGIDPLTNDKAEYWYARLEQIFGAFLKYHPEYYQLRYIDEKGDEIVRADMVGNQVKMIPRGKLRNEAQDIYVSETLKFREGEVYFSDLNLNREHGVIQIPHTPVFRVATPVYDVQKRVRGVVVVNIFAEAIFSKIRTTIGEAKKYVIDQDGHILVHQDRSKEFGFDLGFDYTAKNVMHECVDEMKTRDSLIKYHKNDRHVDGFKKIFFDPKNRDRYWAVIYDIPEQLALKNIYLHRRTMFIVGLLIIVFSLIIITWVFTRQIIMPILKLSEAVNMIEKGDLTARVQEDSRSDEIGQLASSINNMTRIIAKNVNELTILNRVTVAASSSLSIDLMAGNALDAILELQLLKIEKKAAVFVAEDESKTLKLVASRGLSDEQKMLDAVVPFGDCLCGKVAETGEMIFIEKCCDDPRHTRKYAGITPHGQFILPLKSGEKVIGVLVLYLVADTKISNEETRLYKSIADIIAVSLQNVLSFSNIEKLKNQHGLILKSVGEGIYGLDNNGICTFMNPAAERMLGYETGELNGIRVHPITHHTRPDGSAYPREECRIYASFRDNAVYHVNDEVFWRKDGSSFQVEYTSTPIRDESGSAVGAVVVFSDITERKQKEQEIQRSNSLLNAISQAQSRFISAGNPHDLFDELLSKLLSITDSEYGFIGEIFHDADGTPYLKTHAITNIAWNEETQKFYEENSRKGFEFRNLKSLYGTVITTGKMLISNSPSTDPRRGGIPEGHPPINALLCLPFFSGEEMVGMAGVANRTGGYDEAMAEYLQPLIAICGNIIEAHRNTKLRKKAEDKIKEYAETLEIKVEERTLDLEVARQIAESANKAKSDFLANMSHELRTPLNSIIGFSEAMMDGLTGNVTDDQKGYLKDIAESGSHLLSLINDILDLSKVEAGKMVLELGEINMKDIVNSCLLMFREKAMKHGIKLKAEIEEGIGNIEADERKIKQVMFNLLSNAFKFIPEGGSVQVTARKAHGSQLMAHSKKEVSYELSAMNYQLDRNFIEISVVDTGIGISPEDQKMLFQPFQQLETSYTKKYAGTGLGLNLCKKFVELHGGRIWVESEVGKGSKFIFVIPIKTMDER